MIAEEAARVGRRVRVEGSREGETGSEGGRKGGLVAEVVFQRLGFRDSTDFGEGLLHRHTLK